VSERLTSAGGGLAGKPRGPRTRLWLWVAAAIAVAFLGGGGGLLLALMQDMPEIRQLESYRPSAATRVYSADGEVLGQFFIERRLPVRLAEVPINLRQAVVAVEDQNFYHHIGIDLRGIARAVYEDLQAGEFVQGGSTITQQLARGLFLTPEKTLRRKLREALLALHIERNYTKDEILERYLNQIYLGSGAYGVEAAAQTYFGKKVSELTLAEAALIAGLPQYPSVYSPLVNPTRALARRRVVLDKMYERGYITAEQMKRANKEPLHLAQRRPGTRAPYFVEHIRQMLEDQLGQNALYKGGLSIVTTLDARMQEAAEAAVRTGMAELDARIRLRDPEGKELPQVALVALDPHSGEIKALVGGRDFEKSRYNRALQARRQPGSAFKPIVYSYAMEAGFTCSSRVLDAPLSLPNGRGGMWSPANYHHEYKGVITLAEALQTSQNTASVRLLCRLGASPVVAHAHRLGIESPLGRDLSLALGSYGVNILELTGAYAVFDNDGIRVDPVAVREVRDSLGRLLWKPERTRQRVMSKDGAWMMTMMLRAVVEGGTGVRARELGRPLAGKTGTTSEFRDALFVGYSPGLVAGVWVGFDNCTPLGSGETGARAALPVWIEFMRAALKDVPPQEFEAPKGIGRGYTPTGQILRRVELERAPRAAPVFRSPRGGITETTLFN
jgi:penicillin-binding protein 1A